MLHQTLTVVVRTFLPILVMLALAPAPQADAAEAAWNVKCGVSHYKTDDPIVYPGQPGAAHMHAFFGNTGTNAATTTASLLAAPSTCQRGFEGADRSGYWVPALYRQAAGGGIEQVIAGAKTQDVTVYYRRGGRENGPTVQPFPQGLRMIAGDPKATAPQEDKVARWRCRQPKADFIGPAQPGIPTCTAGQFLQGVINFPSCWNGRDLDSADHKSHMAYPTGRNTACPATHPVKLPAVTMEVSYRDINGNGAQYSLASGGQYSQHADFFAAWDNQVQSALVNSCLNTTRKCTGINFNEVNLAAATAGSGSGGAVLAAKTDAAATPAPVDQAHDHIAITRTAAQPQAALPAQPAVAAAATLPAAGPGVAYAGLGVTAMLLGLVYYRRSRRTLRDALRQPRL